MISGNTSSSLSIIAPNNNGNTNISVNESSVVSPPSNHDVKKIELEREQEFRFEVDFDKVLLVKLLEGTAECFGTELAQFQEYIFSGGKYGIFTWHHCILEVSGESQSSYISENPSMISYLNVHQILHNRRTEVATGNAKVSDSIGPRVIIAGPTDSGKSTLSKILVNYGCRQGFRPIFVDLDVGQGIITVPGMISAISINSPIPVGQVEFSNPPLVYFYGATNPSENIQLYKFQIENLAADINQKFEKNQKERNSGIIINTCGWIDGLGYELLLHSINIFQTDLVLVLDHDRLYNDLISQLRDSSIKIVKLNKSNGVITRDSNFRKKTRSSRIKEYFYGINQNLSPHSTVLDFRFVKIFKIVSATGNTELTNTENDSQLKLVEIVPNNDIIHSLLAISYAKTVDTILQSNIAGFIFINDISVERQKMTVLTPSPGLLPSKFLLLGSLKWIE